MTFGNPAFCLALYLTGVHFRGELQRVGQVGGQKIKCQPVRNREISSVRLREELYDGECKIHLHGVLVSRKGGIGF